MQAKSIGKFFSRLGIQDIFLGMMMIVFFLIAGIIHHQNPMPKINLSKQETALNINQDILFLVNLGNKRLLSTILWIQTLIESDEEHYKKRDLNSWMFLRFSTIANLDPLFFENYLFGGLYLSIVKDDLDGAEIIFDQGLTYYPDDYKLNYYAGFNSYFEKGDFKKGLQYLSKIENHPQSPPFLQSIINKLKYKNGVDLNLIFNFVLHNFNSTNDQGIKSKLREDLYSLKAEIDLKCLNEGEGIKNCELKDLDNQNYIKHEGRYMSKKKIKKFEINRKRF